MFQERVAEIPCAPVRSAETFQPAAVRGKKLTGFRIGDACPVMRYLFSQCKQKKNVEVGMIGMPVYAAHLQALGTDFFGALLDKRIGFIDQPGEIPGMVANWAEVVAAQPEYLVD